MWQATFVPFAIGMTSGQPQAYGKSHELARKSLAQGVVVGQKSADCGVMSDACPLVNVLILALGSLTLVGGSHQINYLAFLLSK